MAETLTIKVQTRHSQECSHRADLYFRKCNCRKQIYIYENGRARTESAKTRSWEKAEALVRERLGERDPAVVEARLLAAERARLLADEEEKRAAAAAARIPIARAVEEWLAGLQPKSRSRASQFQSITAKLRSWAQEKGLTYLDEIKAAQLYAWHGQWSSKAANLRDRMGPSTQNIYVSHLRRFFKWAVLVDYLLKDPSLILQQRKYQRIQTKPLHDEAQFREVLGATYRMDANRYRLRDVPEYGRDLRAIFLLQRWTGIRLIDALTLEHSAIRVCPSTGRTLMTLTTKKTGKLIQDRPLPLEVVQALGTIPRRQPHVRPGYYFWSAGTKIDWLTVQWTRRISELNRFLSLQDEDGRPMTFRSHMLRDTFAVELLLHDVPLEEVSKLLTHDSIRMTERYYSPWIKKRREKLHDSMVAAMQRMGARFTPACEPVLSPVQPRLM